MFYDAQRKDSPPILRIAEFLTADEAKHLAALGVSAAKAGSTANTGEDEDEDAVSFAVFCIHALGMTRV